MLYVAKNLLCNWYSNQLIGLKVIGLTVLLIILWIMMAQNWCNYTRHSTYKHLVLYIVFMLSRPYMKTSVKRIGTVSVPVNLLFKYGTRVYACQPNLFFALLNLLTITRNHVSVDSFYDFFLEKSSWYIRCTWAGLHNVTSKFQPRFPSLQS
jgi:hypothetical protein